MKAAKASGFPVSLLKSALQKSIRRNDTRRALKCAKQLLSKAPNEFWRRLPIIIVEDVVLHPKMMEIVKMAKETRLKSYLAKSNRRRQMRDGEFGLKVVAQLCECTVRDYEYPKFLYGLANLDTLPDSRDLKGLNEKETELVEALNLRKSYWGMVGDLKLLDIVARIWIQRFRKKLMTTDELQKLVPITRVKYFAISDEASIDDILLEAVDYHCSPILNILLSKSTVIEAMREEWGEMNPSQMKKKLERIIWDCRSGINLKEDITSARTFNERGSIVNDNDPVEQDKVKNVFAKIRTEIDSVSSWFIKTSLTV